MTSGYTAELGEQDKHARNDIPCPPMTRGGIFMLAQEMRHNKCSQKGCQEASHQDKLFLA